MSCQGVQALQVHNEGSFTGNVMIISAFRWRLCLLGEGRIKKQNTRDVLFNYL